MAAEAAEMVFGSQLVLAWMSPGTFLMDEPGPHLRRDARNETSYFCIFMKNREGHPAALELRTRRIWSNFLALITFYSSQNPPLD